MTQGAGGGDLIGGRSKKGQRLGLMQQRRQMADYHREMRRQPGLVDVCQLPRYLAKRGRVVATTRRHRGVPAQRLPDRLYLGGVDALSYPAGGGAVGEGCWVDAEGLGYAVEHRQALEVAFALLDFVQPGR
jgi:hypothetical protein